MTSYSVPRPPIRSFRKGSGDISEINARRLGLSFGVLDFLVAFTYLIALDNSIYYGISIGLKVLLVFRLSSEQGVRLEARNVFLISTLVLSVFVALAQRDVEISTIVQVSGFIGHLFLSGSYIRRREHHGYITAITAMAGLVIIVYMALFFARQIPTVYGRYQFFGGSHPNLGGEILAAGVFVAGMKLSPNRFLLFSAAALLPLMYMQSRAAMVFILLLQAVCLVYSYVLNGSRLVQGVTVLAGLGVLVGLAMNPDVISEVFLLNDPYRGVGTGFVGRDTLWQNAFDAFITSPIFGNGYGYFDAIKSAGAHNFFLFTLAENGIFSLIIDGWVLYGIFRFGLARSRELFWFMSFLILAWFNDRFANLNPFPFLFYVFMWMDSEPIRVRCLASGAARRVIAAAIDRRPLRSAGSLIGQPGHRG